MKIREVLSNLQTDRYIHLQNNQMIRVAKYDNDVFYIFYSYNSLIAIYNACNYELAINTDKFDYSKTTMKWLKYFINNFTAHDYDSAMQFKKYVYQCDYVTQFTD